MHSPLNEQNLLYLQIAKMLEDGILRGVYAEEEQVPSTNELARHYHINPATGAKGINQLVEEGILYKRRGIGMFVSPGAVQAIRKKRRAAFYEQYILPMAAEARHLGLSGGDITEMLRQADKEDHHE